MIPVRQGGSPKRLGVGLAAPRNAASGSLSTMGVVSSRNRGGDRRRFDAIADAARRCPGLELLLLHGSRARGDWVPGSDWDIGYVADPELDVVSMRAAFSEALAGERLDLVDLEAATDFERFVAARDGRPLFERDGGAFARFWTVAVAAWRGIEPTDEPDHEPFLRGLFE